MPIRQKVSTILGVRIKEGRWTTYSEALDRDGKLTRKTMLDILMSLCEEVEVLEERIQELEEKRSK